MSLVSPSLPHTRRSIRSRKLSAILTALIVACAIVIEALHGHECSGDGCVLCLIAVWAHALLCLCVGLTIARPVIHVLKHVRVVRACRILWQANRLRRICLSEPERPAFTPLSMGVMLRI